MSLFSLNLVTYSNNVLAFEKRGLLFCFLQINLIKTNKNDIIVQLERFNDDFFEETVIIFILYWNISIILSYFYWLFTKNLILRLYGRSNTIFLKQSSKIIKYFNLKISKLLITRCVRSFAREYQTINCILFVTAKMSNIKKVSKSTEVNLLKFERLIFLPLWVQWLF